MRYNYDKERNEVIIKGCLSCPFLLQYEERFMCSLDESVFNVINEWLITNNFPKNCPLRDPNFKFTRIGI